MWWERNVHDSEDGRRRARRRLPRIVFDYIDGAAGTETARRRNEQDLTGLRVVPRVLAGVDAIRLEVSFLGVTYRLPFGIAPMGMCNLACPRADALLALEAARRDIPMAVSTAASTSLERTHELSEGRAWFQLYVAGSVEQGFGLAERAARAGYKTLVLTVDVPRVARRPRDVRNGFQMPFRIGVRQAIDFALHPRWSIATLLGGVPAPANFETGGGFNRNASRAGANWDFLARLRERWKGSLIVKGVMSPKDASRIKAAGIDAIYVSNHGGRQLDSSPSAISALPLVRAAVGAGYPLIFDSGVRSGEDIVKAHAAGADLVMLGRPLLYALAAGGGLGLKTLLDGISADIAIALAQIGLGCMDEVDARVLVTNGEPG